MSTKIVKAIDKKYVAELAKEFRQAGAQVKEMLSLRMLFVDNDQDEPTFTAAWINHPLIEKIGDGERTVKGAVDQVIDFPEARSFFDASWPLPRIIRRRPPWSRTRIKHPFSTFFRSARDGTGVDIYVVDTGAEEAHAEFGGRVSVFMEIYGDATGTGDDNGHGTGVMSAALGSTVGIARGALGWCSKGLTSGNVGTETNIIAAIGACLDHYNSRSATNRPAVLNISIIAVGASFVGDAVAECMDAGMVVVAAAGNSREDVSTLAQDGVAGVGAYPAIEPDVICVGGSQPIDAPYHQNGSGTNYGDRVDIVAPGQVCWLATASVEGISGGYGARSGTSFASPYVAGVVACMLQGHNRLNNRTKVIAVKNKLLANATTGYFANTMYDLTLPDKMLYLDPEQTAPEPITGL